MTNGYAGSILRIDLSTGAVLGSKKFKAIAVRGTKGLGVHNPKGFMETVEGYSKRITTHPGPQTRSIVGTTAILEVANQ